MLNVAVLGCGWAGKAHLRAYQKNRNTNIVSVFGIPFESTVKVAKEFGAKPYNDFDKMVREMDIDIIDICLPTYLHIEYLEKCKSRNVHIFCEKPFTLNYDESKELESQFKLYEKKIMVGYVVRFFNAYEIARNFVKENKYGNIISVYLYRLSAMPPWSPWYKDEKLSGGGVVDLYIHDLDYVYWLLGYPSKIYSVGSKIKNTNNWAQAFTVFNYPGETHAIIETNQDMPGYFPFTFGFRINYEDATLVYNFTAPEKEKGDFDSIFYGNLKIYERGKSFGREIKLDSKDPYEKEIFYFIDRVINNEPIEIGNLKDAVWGMQITDMVKSSLKNH